MAGGKYPFAHDENGGDEAVSRPRRALRLMDVLEGESTPLRAPRSATDRGSKGAGKPILGRESRSGATRRPSETLHESEPEFLPDLARELPPEAFFEPMPETFLEPSYEIMPAPVSEPVSEPMPVLPSDCLFDQPQKPPRSAAEPVICRPTILSVTPEGEGETVAVVLALPPEEGSGASKPRRVRFHLLVEQYADLKGAEAVEAFGRLPREITPEQADALIEAGELCAAIRRGLGLLQYGDRSAKRLASGLTAKGVPRETAAAAAEYLTRKGYIHEDDTVRVRVRQSLRKGWGPRRIREDLRAQGFGADALEEAMEDLAEVDFAENCAAVIRKKYGETPDELPSQRGERQKMTAALMRLGYDPDHIREALRIIERGG